MDGEGGQKTAKNVPKQAYNQSEWKRMKRNSVFLSWLAGLSMKFGVQGHMDHIGYIGPGGGGGEKNPNKGSRNASNGRAQKK